MAKKRFLILTENLGKTAPGIVFERLIGEIGKRSDIDVVCLNNNAESVANAVYSRPATNARFPHALSPSNKARLSKLSLRLIGDDWAARLNAIALFEVFKSHDSSARQYDYIFSLVSYRHTSPLLVAERLIKEGVAKKNIAYFVDAIPAPLGWSTNNREFRGLKRFTAKRIKRLDAIFSSNAQMLKYQLSLNGGELNIPSSVLFNPIVGDQKDFPPPLGEDYKFLYTGGLYGKRTVKHVLGALKILLRKGRNAYLVFVGTNISEADLSSLSDIERKHVLIEPFCRSLDKYYEDSTALLDIDADMDDDVFLSSKVTNYLEVNRIIISETGANSPASGLFLGMNSIIQCPHDPVRIADAMIYAIQRARDIKFDDRLDLLRAFSVSSVVDRMENLISLELA